MEPSRISNKLKMFRGCRGYSQKKVARVLGLSDTSSLSRWEHGEAIPSTVQVFRLAAMYETLPHELFDGLWNQIGSETSLFAQHEQFSSSQSFLYEHLDFGERTSSVLFTI